MIPLTPVVKNLLIINVIIFFAIQISPPEFGSMMAMRDYSSGYFRPYQLVTSMFTHFSLSHLFFNMLGLYFFGPLVERTVGSKRTVIAYLVGGLISALVYLLYYSFLSQTHTNYALMGASGALFAILVICAMYHPKQIIQLIFPPIQLTLSVAVLIYIAIDLFMFVSGKSSGIANLAHLGGAAAGAIMALIWKR